MEFAYDRVDEITSYSRRICQIYGYALDENDFGSKLRRMEGVIETIASRHFLLEDYHLAYIVKKEIQRKDGQIADPELLIDITKNLIHKGKLLEFWKPNKEWNSVYAIKYHLSNAPLFSRVLSFAYNQLRAEGVIRAEQILKFGGKLGIRSEGNWAYHIIDHLCLSGTAELSGTY